MPAATTLLVMMAVQASRGPAPASLDEAYLRSAGVQQRIETSRDLEEVAREIRKLAAVARAVMGSTVDSTSQEALRRRIVQGVESTLANSAVQAHNAGRKRRNPGLLRLALVGYEEYLALFPEAPKAYDLRFFFAELLCDNLGQPARAASEYTRVLLQDAARIETGEAPGRWMEPAAYNAVWALDEVSRTEDRRRPANTASDPRVPLPIPSTKRELLLACERYLEHVPEGQHALSVGYKTGYLYYFYNHFDRAIPLLSRFALEYPEAPDDLGPAAARLVLDSFYLLQDWEQLSNWARRFSAEPGLAKVLGEELPQAVTESESKLAREKE